MRRSIQRTIERQKNKSRRVFGKPETFSVQIPDEAGKGGVMKRILTAAQMRQADHNTIETMGIPSLVLMERAALSCVEELENGRWNLKKVLAVCGPGNNGGDGAAIARILKTKGVDAQLFCLGNPEKYSEGMKAQKKIAENYGVREVKNPDFREYTVIIDAIFGIGVSRPLAGEYRKAVEEIYASGIPVLAVDIPSGIHTDTGEVLDAAVKARTTVTFACAKPGLLLDPGKRYAGDVRIRDIGIGFAAGEEETPWYGSVEKEDLDRFLARTPMGNKGTFGKVLVIAGSDVMCGAAILCARAVLASGAGMVKVVTEIRNRTPLFCALPEAMADFWTEGEPIPEETLLQDLAWADAVVAGPGLSKSRTAKELLTFAAKHTEVPLVLDADALNLIAEDPAILSGCKAEKILTPHVGELARLLHTTIAKCQRDPAGSAKKAAEEYRACCVRKDSVTVTAEEGREQYYINTSGSSALATAGSGDVLAGITGAFAAKRQCGKEREISLAKTAALAVYAHGKAGEAAEKRSSASYVTASEIIKGLQTI